MSVMEVLVDALSALGWRLLGLVKSPGCGEEKSTPGGGAQTFAGTLLSVLDRGEVLGGTGRAVEETAALAMPETRMQEAASQHDSTAEEVPFELLAQGTRPVPVPEQPVCAGPDASQEERPSVRFVSSRPEEPKASGAEAGALEAGELPRFVGREVVGAPTRGEAQALARGEDPAGSGEAGNGRDLPSLGTSKPAGRRVGGPDVAAAMAGEARVPTGSGNRAREGGTEMANRDLALLDPVFRQRLARVMERMEKEAGYRVELVEGYRSPERQEALFRQGRTEPGQVVTWTRNSLHSRGRAADLLVDGRWDYHEGYQVLQRIAQEEGLHTLGPRDPGHLELREGEGRHARSPGEPAWEGGGPRVAVPSRVADPGPAASVAQLDSFASAPARPARPAAPAFLASSPHFREQGTATASVRQERPSGAGIRSTLFLGHTGGGVPEGAGTTAGQEGRSGLVDGSWAQVALEPQGAGARRTENVPRPEPADRLVSHQNLRDSAPPPSSGDPRRLAKAFGEAPTPVLGGAPDSAKGLGEGGTLGRRIDSAWVGGMPKPAEGLGEGGGAERTPRFEAGRMGGGGSPLPGEREVQAQAIPNLQGPLALSGLEGGIGEVGGRAESGGPLSVQRAFEVTEMREAGAPAGRLHLELEDLDGEGTRLRLALRGGRLDGVLELQDPLAAARVRLRVGELHEALLRHGLDGRNLVVRGPGENSETVGPARRGSATQEDSWFSKGGSPWQRERGKERGS